MSSVCCPQPFGKRDGRGDGKTATGWQDAAAKHERRGGKRFADRRTVFIITAPAVILERGTAQLHESLIIDAADHKTLVVGMVAPDSFELFRRVQPPAVDAQIYALTA